MAVGAENATDSAICQLPADPGPCRGAKPRWVYNGKECTQFKYGGCEGNKNNFLTKNDCENACANATGKFADFTYSYSPRRQKIRSHFT